MKLKYILIGITLLLIISNTVTALSINKYYDSDGVGFWELYNGDGGAQINYYYSTCDTPLYFKYYMTTYYYSGYNSKSVYYTTPYLSLYSNTASGAGTKSFSHTVVNPSTTSAGISVYTHAPDGNPSRSQIYVSNAIISDSTISGNFSCITSVDFFIKDGNGDYEIKGTDSSSPYSFNGFTGFTYKLVFSDGHEYEFLCNGNVIYDYDVCTYITLNFKDNCGNLIPDTEFQYCNHGATIVCYLDNTSSGSYDIFYEDQDSLEIWTYKHDGSLYYNIENPQDISYSINDPHISWNNNIFVKDYNNSLIIEDALVSFSQDCIIDTSLNPVRNKYTNIDGYAIFDQCELDTAYITAIKDGYKTFSDSISPIHLNAQKSGQTTIINLVPNEDILNESEYISTNYNTYIYFKNVDGNIINSILDTDSYVDLYYYNNNSEEASMVLQFYKTNIYTGKTILLNWNIPHGESGYKRILNANYTQTNYGYCGYLYSNSISGWNTKKRLTISNNTIEVINHYQNLTRGLWFVNKNGNHSIDYRNEIKIIAYAKSNYSFLHDITLKLYDNNVLIESITLDVFDFIASDIENYYEWNLGYNYTKDHNYTIEMYGYDDTFLKLDYINAIDLRKNKLTIIVKDRAGSTLTNSYIFLEGYPSLSTSNTYFNSYENLDNGIYKYKASKSGYSGSGWDTINLTNGDKIVSYVLSYDTGNTTYLPDKMSDNTISTLFFPFMFFLLIVILLGGLMHVVE